MNGGLIDIDFRYKIPPVAGEFRIRCGEVGPINYLIRLAGVSVMTKKLFPYLPAKLERSGQDDLQPVAGICLSGMSV